jgi:hypothetical protein
MLLEVLKPMWDIALLCATEPMHLLQWTNNSLKQANISLRKTVSIK